MRSSPVRRAVDRRVPHVSGNDVQDRRQCGGPSDASPGGGTIRRWQRYSVMALVILGPISWKSSTHESQIAF